MSGTPSGQRPGGKQRLLLRVERFSRERYRLVLLLALVAVVAATWLGSHLKLESDILELIPKGNPKVDTFRAALRDFGSIDFLMILFEAGDEEGPDELEDFADLVAEKLLEEEELVEFVDYRFSPDERFLQLFYENALLFLPPDKLPELREKLTDEAIQHQIHADRLSLSSPTALLTQNLVVNDPLDLMPFFLNRLLGHRGALQVDLSDGYYLSRDGKSLIMLVKPTGISHDLEFGQRLLSAVHRAERETRRELEEELGEGAVHISTRHGGNYAIAVEESGLIYQDARFNLVFSLFLVSGLYWLCYRRFAALLYSSVPLMVGQALTFALAFFVLGRLNSASSAFTALLMGLGTDFTIVMYARYVEERQSGKNLAQATERMVGWTGLGVFTGAITSAGTFYAMCVSRFRGLFDLGLLLGSGILLCAVAILFLLPAMITWNEGVRKRKVDSIKKLHLQSFFLEHLIPFSARYRWAVLTVLAVLTAGGAYLATRLEFDDTMKALRSHRSEALKVQEEIARKYGAALSYMMAIAHGDTLEEAVQRAEQVEKRLQPFVDSGVLGSYDSILTYLPPVDEQESIIRAIRDEGGDAFDPKRIRRTFLRALDRNGFRREPFETYLSRMESFLTPDRPITLEDLRRQGLDRIVDRYVNEKAKRVRVVTYLFPTRKEWKRRPPPGLAEAISAGDPNIVVTGTNVVNQELRRMFSIDLVRSVVVGLVLVFILLLVDFKSLKLTSIAMAQLVTGVILMLGLMKVVGIRINYVNAFVTTMILGVGIDYSIHLVHRLHVSRGKIEPGLLETGKAVVMAALTNMAGFGTLVAGNYPAVKGFGMVALIGSVTCLFTALTLVPALMAKTDSSTPDP